MVSSLIQCEDNNFQKPSRKSEINSSPACKGNLQFSTGYRTSRMASVETDEKYFLRNYYNFPPVRTHPPDAKDTNKALSPKHIMGKSACEPPRGVETRAIHPGIPLYRYFKVRLDIAASMLYQSGLDAVASFGDQKNK
ncbi:hypothetical protein G5I_06944 [Acromyrmex echinatior]|uniref:Uncharacterized protein n=1 Tax=Acromyrmex echinatior TaxID=103372 RepID=F4WMB0_ACREC|nr:hypothetical protein G5I_06944 [Acromyrmex echinatior]